jgi:hypothetical protein
MTTVTAVPQAGTEIIVPEDYEGLEVPDLPETCTEQQAREIDARLRRVKDEADAALREHGNRLALVVFEAWYTQTWRTLGFGSWGEYAEHVGLRRSESYKKIAEGRCQWLIDACFTRRGLPAGTVKVNGHQTRFLQYERLTTETVTSVEVHADRIQAAMHAGASAADLAAMAQEAQAEVNARAAQAKAANDTRLGRRPARATTQVLEATGRPVGQPTPAPVAADQGGGWSPAARRIMTGRVNDTARLYTTVAPPMADPTLVADWLLEEGADPEALVKALGRTVRYLSAVAQAIEDLQTAGGRPTPRTSPDSHIEV